MEFKEEKVSLVIVGAWNPAIFSSEWVSRNLLDGEQINVAVPNIDSSFTLIGASYKYSTEEINIQVISNALRLNSITFSDLSLNRIEEIATKTAEYLPHTPIVAFGFNIGFSSPSNERINRWLESESNDFMNGINYRVHKQTLIKTYKRDDSYDLNLTLNCEIDKDSLIDFNFHFPVTSLVELKEILSSEHFVDYKNHSIQLLDSLFNLKFE